MLLEFLKIGGPLMWVLLVLSIVSLSIILERIFFFRKNEKKITRTFKIDLIKAVSEKDIKKACKICEKEKNTLGQTLKEFLERYKSDGDFQHFEHLIKEIAMERLELLEKRLHILGVIGYTSPMIGLLGTVTGMIIAFNSLASQGAGDPSIVANGISQALLTTAAGLIIAIPTIVAYNLFNKRIELIEGSIDKLATNLIDIIRLK